MTKETMTYTLHRREGNSRWAVLELAEDVFLPTRLWNNQEILNYYDPDVDGEDYTLSICFTLEEAWQEIDRVIGLIKSAVIYNDMEEEETK